PTMPRHPTSTLFPYTTLFRSLTTFTDETVRGAGVSPRDGTVVLGADHDGDEFHQLYLLEAGKGWPEQLTNEPEVQHFVGSTAWSDRKSTRLNSSHLGISYAVF